MKNLWDHLKFYGGAIITLKFYADRDNYLAGVPGRWRYVGDDPNPEWEADDGSRARRALAGWEDLLEES